MLASCIHFPIRRFYKGARFCRQTPLPESAVETRLSSSPIIRVSNSGGNGGGCGIVVEFDKSRYIFNCGESTDRLLKDVRWNSSNLRNIFLTHLSWKNMGGLASLGLFLQEKGVKYISVHGPRGADQWMEYASCFVKMHSTTVDIQSCDQNKPYVSALCKIESIPIKDGNPNTINRIPLHKDWKTNKEMIDFYYYDRRKMSSRSFLKKKPEGPVDLETSYSYICTFMSKQQVSLSKCVERGLQPGPQVYQLLNGQDVILNDGTVVKASDVMEYAPGRFSILVVDCPTKGYLNNLLKNNSFQPYFSKEDSSGDKGSPYVIVHFTPAAVMKDKRYISWMKRFPKETLHLIVNDANYSNSVKAAVLRHEFLKNIHPQIFPPLKGVISRTPSSKDIESKNMPNDTEEASLLWRQQWKSFSKDLRLVEGRTWTSIDVGKSIISRNDELKDQQKSVELELSNVPEYKHASKIFYDKASLLTEKSVSEKSKFKKGPVLTFLGTGAKSSSTVRNTSGILVKISEEKNIMLDCGDGTLGQLAMLFNASELQKTLQFLCAVFISHLHADHHMGLISIILARHKAFSTAGKKLTPLLLLAPEEISGWLSLYHNTYEPILNNVIFIPLRSIELGSEGPASSKYDTHMREMLDMALVCTCRVNHCVGAFGVSFIHKSGWKITYSGDTKFCPSLAKIGMDSDLLIHEATFSSPFQKMANSKKHSTTRDAVNIGKLMKAKHIILTHFSQRYEYLPDIADIKSMEQSNVGIAFDFMQVCFEDLLLLPHLNEVFEAVFPDSVLTNEMGTRRYLKRSSHFLKILIDN